MPFGPIATLTLVSKPSVKVAVPVVPASRPEIVKAVACASAALRIPSAVVATRKATMGGTSTVVSTVTVTGFEGAPTLPAASVSWTVRAWGPSASGSVGLTVKVPSSPTIAVPTGAVPSRSVTVAPASPRPVISGVVSPVVPPWLMTTGLAGAAVSMVTMTTSEAVPTLPTGSVAVALSV
ncbi:hypothetical protein AEGHOMDF_5824 [Methylobacterium soli]|nr:hypothetical protein AEGHOMDF_5824 [Methylobacterium soli]